MKAIEFINESLKIDSGFALAYAGLASAYLKFNNTGYASYEDVLPKIEWAVNKALEIDSTLEEAHSIESNIQFDKNRDYNKREKKIKRVIEQNPSFLDGHYDYLYFLRGLGRHQEALRELKIIQQLDPLSEFLYSTAARTYFFARKWDKAIENFRFDLELDPDNINTKWWLARAYAHNGNYEEAVAEFLSRNVKSPETNWALGCAYAAAGYPEKARKILNFLLEKEKTTYVPGNYIARLFIALEDYDKAFEYFDKGGWIDSIVNDPLLDPVRKDPRFTKFVRKWNFPQNIEERVLNGESFL